METSKLDLTKTIGQLRNESVIQLTNLNVVHHILIDASIPMDKIPTILDELTVEQFIFGLLNGRDPHGLDHHKIGVTNQVKIILNSVYVDHVYNHSDKTGNKGTLTITGQVVCKE